MSINISSLTYEVDNKKILNEISLKIELGEVLCVLGPNGSGKSTLVNLISGNFEATRGDIFFDKVDLKKISIEDRAFTRSVMSQLQPIAFDFSVKEIVEMGWVDRGESEYADQFDDAVNEVIGKCGVKDLIDRNFNTLSGGEQRRIHFARTLLQLWRPSNSNDPKYLFLDEPTANLDLTYEIKLLNIVKEVAQEGAGVMLVLHDLNLAAKFSDKVAILKGGSIIDIGLPKDVLKSTLLSDIYEIDVEVKDDPLLITYY